MSDRDVVIRVEQLAKQYRITGVREPYQTLRDAITRSARAAASRLTGRGASRDDDTIWALDDLSFEVQRGTALGIVGRNGAGKTTLLSILSRITRPTRGRAVISGSCSSLLSVGTGFHQELSGRDNVYLNGAILGMSRRYIRERFDEIVAFAEVEKFIDTPVKHYSSGMQMRLGFAVAAFLEAEILLIDEVLAVGDAAFQKKCIAKIDDVAHNGRTVLFVSHHMAAVSQMCTHAVWLDAGRARKMGDTASVITAYLSDAAVSSGERRFDDDGMRQPGDHRMKLRAVRVVNSAGVPSATLDVGKPFAVEIEYEVLEPLASSMVSFTLLTNDGIPVFTTADTFDGFVGEAGRTPGIWVSRCDIMGSFLNDGGYHLTVLGDIPYVEIVFHEEVALSFTMEQTGEVIGSFPEHMPGVICPALPWTIERTG